MPSDMERTKQFLEQSFVSAYLSNPSITDISFNGGALYVLKTNTGREKLPIQPTYEEVYEFIKQIANFMNVAFNYTEPFLDVSIDRYRLFAVGPSIARRGYDPTITFALRIHHHTRLIPSLFLHKDSRFTSLIHTCVYHRLSIVISGITGVGKTQLQKEVLHCLPDATRVILIDNILELDGLQLPHLDITMWQVKPRYPLQQFIEAALRSNPDWLMIAESRGKDFQHVLHSVMTGHPIITTLHSDSAEATDQRMLRMILLDDHQSNPELILKDIHDHFPVIIYIEKTQTPPIKRFIRTVMIRFNGHVWNFTDSQSLETFQALWETCQWQLSLR